jgi:hypothetical protein
VTIQARRHLLENLAQKPPKDVIKSEKWTKKDEDLVCELHSEFGTDWSKYKTKLPHRDAEQVKTRWYNKLANKTSAAEKEKRPAKRTKPAFTRFCQAKRAKCVGTKVSQKLLDQQWKAASDAEKQPFYIAQQADKERLKREKLERKEEAKAEKEAKDAKAEEEAEAKAKEEAEAKAEEEAEAADMDVSVGAAGSSIVTATAKVSKQHTKTKRRCGSCAGCIAINCDKCKNCLDKVCNGGAGTLRKPCMRRKCTGDIAAVRAKAVANKAAAGTLGGVCVKSSACARPNRHSGMCNKNLGVGGSSRRGSS